MEARAVRRSEAVDLGPAPLVPALRQSTSVPFHSSFLCYNNLDVVISYQPVPENPTGLFEFVRTAGLMVLATIAEVPDRFDRLCCTDELAWCVKSIWASA